MDKEKLNEIIEKHKKWLNFENGGVRADLSHSNLSHSNLSSCDLSHIDLSHSNLRSCDLSHSDLSHSDLSHSNLRSCDLSHSDLSHIDLSHSDMSHSNLRSCNLNHSNLSHSNIDYSSWPLWCRSLDVHIDGRIARQLLYHLMRPCLVSPDVSEDFKRALFTPELIAEANKFHRAEECGLIEMPYEEENHGQSN